MKHLFIFTLVFLASGCLTCSTLPRKTTNSQDELPVERLYLTTDAGTDAK
mgnify:CR=1 FL=1